MFNTAMTYLQLFGIGIGFGLSGPCLLSCTPVMVTYLAGKRATLRQSFTDIIVFLLGRICAYLILGYLAGVSAVVLRQISGSGAAAYIKVLGGVIIVLLGIYVGAGRDPLSWVCRRNANKTFSIGSLFALGFILGIFPCAPLLALLLEVVLVAKSQIQGAIYALSFGLGTFLSGLLVIGALSGIFTWLPQKILKSKTSNLVFRILCALLLVFLGLGLILKRG